MRRKIDSEKDVTLKRDEHIQNNTEKLKKTRKTEIKVLATLFSAKEIDHKKLE